MVHMDSTWYYVGVVVVAVVMCIGLYGLYLKNRAGRNRRR